jgi:TonB family protein
MNNLLLYLLKVSAGTTLFYLSYLLLFRKDTFHLRNRIFLILTLILPTLLPLMKIPVLSDKAIPTTQAIVINNIISPQNVYGTTMSATIHPFDFTILFVWVYFTVTGFLLLRAILSLISTYRIIKNGTHTNNQFPKVIISENKLPPFSFFPYAVIPAQDYESGNYSDILDHEFAHIRQGHTFDLLLSELFIAFQWFNPFVWLIKRSVILNHEYLADHVSLGNRSVKEYQYRLLHFNKGLRSISLAHNFNSLIKNRIIMINKKPTRKYAALKNVLILPLAAFVVNAFATPEYRYSAVPSNDNSMTVYETPAVQQKVIKGIVLNEEGKPIENVNIGCTGTIGNARGFNTGPDGRFIIYGAEENTYLSIFLHGYKDKSVKADFTKEMIIKMEKDPDYQKPKVQIASRDGVPLTNPIIVIDGVITKEPPDVISSKIGNEIGTIMNLSGKDATAKYGEAGKNGATEIYTKKKAAELGIKIPFRRNGPEDFPTFQGGYYTSFNDWVVSNIKYPPEAASKGIQGRITVSFTVEADGSVSKVSLMGKPDQLLGDAALKAIQASPLWEPAKNPEANEPFPSIVSIKFKLPDKVIKDDTYVSVEQMPQYPGGDMELLNFINANTNYPEAARAEKIGGRVIIRFIVNKEGDVEEPVILKGVHPLLDAEALRVISMLKGFTPGSQGGTPVDVYYMVPVNFSLSASEPLFSKSSESEILKFVAINTGYPEEAKNSADTGKIYVIVKLMKGGVIKECVAVAEKKEINVPILPEVVIIGYKPSAGQNASGMHNVKGNMHPALKTEGVRVAKKLGEIDIPEWKEKNMEFALILNFQLK